MRRAELCVERNGGHVEVHAEKLDKTIIFIKNYYLH